jgi:hypothetical protein
VHANLFFLQNPPSSEYDNLDLFLYPQSKSIKVQFIRCECNVPFFALRSYSILSLLASVCFLISIAVYDTV